MAGKKETRQPREAPPASVSQEMPVVILGEERARTAPRRRLLQGRIHERWILYPAYALQLIAGGFAMIFSLNRVEWSIVPVGLGWGLLFVWTWFYGVAYRYRRSVLKYVSVFVVLGYSGLLAAFCIDRAQEQVVATELGLVSRAFAEELIWSAVITMIAAGLIVAHVVFLGRGYREKKVHGSDGR